jgi:hypothetical protein
MAVRSARRPRHSVVPVGAEGRPHAVHLGLVPALASLLGDGELPVHSRERGINFTRARLGLRDQRAVHWDKMPNIRLAQ